ncbi:MAG: 6-carboxytetrahydropterin synthase [Alistipes sp.]|nr:6-carboxytetrahydropterin synthase [Alistipes sp.]
MATIRLTKEFSFEAAHALGGYDGPCREIHGHSYRLFVTVKGTPSEVEGDPKCGMVMDFGVLKRIVNEEITERLDHALILRKTAVGPDLRALLTREFGNVAEVDYQPTCENMLADFARRIAARLPQGTELWSLRLHETATSFAEWFAEDNPPVGKDRGAIAER